MPGSSSTNVETHWPLLLSNSRRSHASPSPSRSASSTSPSSGKHVVSASAKTPPRPPSSRPSSPTLDCADELTQKTLLTSPPRKGKLSTYQSIAVPSTANFTANRAKRARRGRARRERAAEKQVTGVPMFSYKDYNRVEEFEYIQDAATAESAVGRLQGPIGFDLEWYKNEHIPVATVQLSDPEHIFVIQICAKEMTDLEHPYFHIPKKLKELLENKDIKKIGVGATTEDVVRLKKCGIYLQGTEELTDLAKKKDSDFREKVEEKGLISKLERGKSFSLNDIVMMYTNSQLDKGNIRYSNWEIDPLKEKQIDYAGNDAYCATIVYDKLMQIESKAFFGVT